MNVVASRWPRDDERSSTRKESMRCRGAGVGRFANRRVGDFANAPHESRSPREALSPVSRCRCANVRQRVVRGRGIRVTPWLGSSWTYDARSTAGDAGRRTLREGRCPGAPSRTRCSPLRTYIASAYKADEHSMGSLRRENRRCRAAPARHQSKSTADWTHETSAYRRNR